jgi:hypothetical protein
MKQGSVFCLFLHSHTRSVSIGNTLPCWLVEDHRICNLFHAPGSLLGSVLGSTPNSVSHVLGYTNFSQVILHVRGEMDGKLVSFCHAAPFQMDEAWHVLSQGRPRMGSRVLVARSQ